MDIKKISASYGLTVEEFRGILEVFVPTAQADIGKIGAARQKGDAGAAEEAAHSLKGAAGNLGFVEMSETARRVEIDARNNDLAAIERALPLLAEQLEVIIAQISAGT
jgi:HPt (histidine-containing phosphotransfer) domain-containing protein